MLIGEHCRKKPERLCFSRESKCEAEKKENWCFQTKFIGRFFDVERKVRFCCSKISETKFNSEAVHRKSKEFQRHKALWSLSLLYGSLVGKNNPLPTFRAVGVTFYKHTRLDCESGMRSMLWFVCTKAQWFSFHSIDTRCPASSNYCVALFQPRCRVVYFNFSCALWCK